MLQLKGAKMKSSIKVEVISNHSEHIVKVKLNGLKEEKKFSTYYELKSYLDKFLGLFVREVGGSWGA